jgi:hypothetical protein
MTGTTKRSLPETKVPACNHRIVRHARSFGPASPLRWRHEGRMERPISPTRDVMNHPGSSRRRPSAKGWRRNEAAISPGQRNMIAAMMVAAPLAGSLAAVSALYADSGLLGILVGALSFASLSVMMVPPPGGAAK